MKRKLWVGVLIGLGTLLILLFGFRLAGELRRLKHPHPPAAASDVSLIRDWMTVPYIAHTYCVPPSALFDALGIPEKENRERSLAEIDQQYFPGQEGRALALVQEAILAFQKQAPATPLP